MCFHFQSHMYSAAASIKEIFMQFWFFSTKTLFQIKKNKFTVTDEHTNHIAKKKKPAILPFQRGCQGSFVSTNLSGWCCCWEILIHGKASCRLGQWQTCRWTGPAVGFVLLPEVAPGCPGPWKARQGQELLTDQIPALLPWGCSWKATISVGFSPRDAPYQKPS